MSDEKRRRFASEYGIPDYEPGFGGTLRLLPFQYGGAAWVYFVWSLYSTGRVCLVYSQDGGVTWSGEDALAYWQPAHIALRPDAPR